MRYHIVWQPQAEQQLAAIWLASADRGQVTAASHRIEQLIGTDPWHQGESRSGTTRMLFEHPLAVVYEIIEDDKRVRVLVVRSV